MFNANIPVRIATILTELGHGNRSLGLRKLLDHPHFKVYLDDLLALSKDVEDALREAGSGEGLEEIIARMPEGSGGFTMRKLAEFVRYEIAAARGLSIQPRDKAEPLQLVGFNVFCDHLDTLKKIGSGNLSNGLRLVMEHPGLVAGLEGWLEHVRLGY